MANQNDSDSGQNIYDTLTYTEVGRLIGKHPATISKWVKDGEIPAVRLPSGRHVIRRCDLEKVFGTTTKKDD